MALRLTEEQLRKLREEASKNQPVEACALFFGKRVRGDAVVERVVMAPNILQSSVRFEVDSQLVYSAFGQAEREGLQFVGLFHSHPAPAEPSALDLRYMRLWGDAVWLVLSSIDGGVAAFQMVEGKVRKMAIILNNYLRQT